MRKNNFVKKSSSYREIFEAKQLSELERLYVDNLSWIYENNHKSQFYRYTTYLPEKTICPYCSSVSIKKNGKSKIGNQRYFCNNCGHSFTKTKNTLFNSSKVPIETWFSFLELLFHNATLNQLTKATKTTIKTVFYRLKKVFLALENYQQTIVLRESAFIDETFVKVKQTDFKYKYKKAKIQKRGMANSYCICVGIDYLGYCFAQVSGRSKLSENQSMKIYLPKLKNVTHLLHDGENSHKVLVEKLSCKETVSLSKYNKNGPSPLSKVDGLCRAIKHFLEVHEGYDKENLQNYLNLFVFAHNELLKHDNDTYKCVVDLLNLMLSEQKSLKYS